MVHGLAIVLEGLMKNAVDKHTGSAVFVGQVASKPRVIGRNRTEMAVFLCLAYERALGRDSHTTPVREKLSAVAYDGFELPGTFESAIFENHRSHTMQTAPQWSAPAAAPCPVVSIIPYLSHATAKQLVAEALKQKTGPGESLEASVVMLPDLFFCVLDLVLQNFDYNRNKQAPAAVACRLLAASVNHYSEKLEEISQ